MQEQKSMFSQAFQKNFGYEMILYFGATELICINEIKSKNLSSISWMTCFTAKQFRQKTENICFYFERNFCFDYSYHRTAVWSVLFIYEYFFFCILLSRQLV